MACWICGAEGLEYEDGVDARDRPPTLGPMDYLLKYLQELVLPLPRLAASPEAPPAAFDAAPPLANMWPPPADEPVGAPPPRTEPKTPSAAVANKGATPRAKPTTLAKILEDDDTPAPALGDAPRRPLRAHAITQKHLTNWGESDSESEVGDSASEAGTPAKVARPRGAKPKLAFADLKNVLQ
ncbi:hypothetical protein JL720_2644 [Aureococcus anophagefferens]|nr:hypothetical protein JL720_2644 [Aureococcus anophagefferens]